MAELQIRRLGYALGAEVRGVDLTGSLDDATIADIRKAWLDHLVLCFPDQNLSKDGLVAFARRFGEIDDNRTNKTRDPENVHVTFVTNKAVAGKAFDGYKGGQNWHSDRSYTARPAPGTFLFAKELPDVGGNTIFSNQYMAYEALSPAMRGIVDRLSAVHDYDKIKGNHIQASEVLAINHQAHPPRVHPMTKVHPETHRKALFIGERLRQIEGMTPEESQPLLDFLNRHAVTYEFTYRHRWRVNDLLLWDNRCLLHLAPTDYDLHRQPRHMMRCTLRGPTLGYDWDPSGAAARSESESREAVPVLT
jgi:taurine dioxygenase